MNRVSIFSLIFFIILWESIVKVGQIEQWILPAPSQILYALWDTRGRLFGHTLITLTESAMGFFLGAAVAFVVAVSMHFSEFVKKSVYPLLIVSQTIPFIALAPLLVVWFGFGLLPKILVVALVCFFPIVVNLTEGFSSCERSIILTMRALGAKRWQVFRLAVLPSSLPFFFTGLRIAATYALLTAVVAEWIGAAGGLGIFMTRAAKSYLTDHVFAAIFIVSITSVLFVAIISYLYKLATPWRVVEN